MRLLLIGRQGSINHWLEDAASGLRAADHDVRVAYVRRPWLNRRIETALAEPLAAALARRAAAFAPDLIVVIGGFHAPSPVLDALSALPHRPPLAGWVGDAFEADAAAKAGRYDLIAYTDTGLAARHTSFGFPGTPLFLPHAVDPSRRAPQDSPRTSRLIFVGAATPGRLGVLNAIDTPVAVFGPGWGPLRAGVHRVQAARIAHRRVVRLYGRHLAALNIRNERNVLSGLNQRSFDPYLAATPVLSDDQPDLTACFDPGREVLVWRDVAELNALHERLRRDPSQAARIGEAGRRRVLSQHTFAHRLSALRAALGERP